MKDVAIIFGFYIFINFFQYRMRMNVRSLEHVYWLSTPHIAARTIIYKHVLTQWYRKICVCALSLEIESDIYVPHDVVRTKCAGH